MLITKVLPLDTPETCNSGTSFGGPLPAGVYTGEMVASHSFGSEINCIFVLTNNAGTDFLVSCSASKDDVRNMLGRLYGLDIPLSCLNDLIGRPVTVEIKCLKGKICIEPYQPLGGTVQNNDNKTSKKQ